MILEIKGNPIPNARPKSRIISTGSKKDLLEELNEALFALKSKEVPIRSVIDYVYDSITMVQSSKSFISVYDPQKKEKEDVRSKLRPQFPRLPLLGPIRLRLYFYMPRPKSHYGTGKNSKLLKPSSPLHHTKRPDIDNLEKFILDCMTGIVYKDDTQVFRVDEKEKIYCDTGEEKTVIHIIEVIT